MNGTAGRTVQRTFPRYAPEVWLFVRLVLAVEWLRGGWSKAGDAGWTAAPVGAAVEGFLSGAIEKSTAGAHPEVPHWYHQLAEDVFLPNADVFAYLVAYGELLVGVALAVGLFTRWAALGGVAMNLAFLWAGTTSTNPPLLVLGLGLVFASDAAGRIGADGWLLPRLRTALPASWQRLVSEALFAAALLAGAWLALVASNWATWIGAFLVALLATAAALRLGYRQPDTEAAG